MGHRKAEAKNWEVVIHLQHQKCLFFFLLECCGQPRFKLSRQQPCPRFQLSRQQTCSMCRLKVKVKVTQSCPTLWNTMDYVVHGILQARILEWVACPFSSGSSQPMNWTRVSCIAGRFITYWAIREALYVSLSFNKYIFLSVVWRLLCWFLKDPQEFMKKVFSPETLLGMTHT